MPLSTIQPVFADDPRDPDALLVTLGPETRHIRKSEIGAVVDGMRRTDEAVVAQLGNILVGTFPTAAAVESASAAQIQAVVSQTQFYW